MRPIFTSATIVLDQEAAKPISVGALVDRAGSTFPQLLVEGDEMQKLKGSNHSPWLETILVKHVQGF